MVSGEVTSVTNSGTIEVGGSGSKGVSIAGGASYSAEAESRLEIKGNDNCSGDASSLENYTYGVYALSGTVNNSGLFPATAKAEQSASIPAKADRLRIPEAVKRAVSAGWNTVFTWMRKEALKIRRYPG